MNLKEHRFWCSSRLLTFTSVYVAISVKLLENTERFSIHLIIFSVFTGGTHKTSDESQNCLGCNERYSVNGPNPLDFFTVNL